MKNKLMASSLTKEGIINLIEEFWYRKDVTLVDFPSHKYNEIYIVMLADKAIDDFIVAKRKGRYRFEEVIKSD